MRWSIVVCLAATEALVVPRPGAATFSRRRVVGARREGDELPPVQPGEIDWDDEFRKVMDKKAAAPIVDPKEVALQLDRSRQRASNALKSTANGVKSAATNKTGEGFKFWIAVLVGLSVFPIVINALSAASAPPASSLYI
mmetsp:Transcript_20155/g.68263  ORF Transcript_20155/g.68263 Transcript_20155/m.68263 type:complete len:140 (+) Transcript_20155:18-437(+)